MIDVGGVCGIRSVVSPYFLSVTRHNTSIFHTSIRYGSKDLSQVKNEKHKILFII